MKSYIKKLRLIVVMLLSITILAACGAGNGDSETPASSDETSFLMGTWFAESAEYEGQELDPDEVFGDTFSLYFAEDGKCTMWVGQNKALVDWEYTGDGVTLTGEDTYEITFPDESRETMIITVRDVEVLMEKYEE